MNKLLQGSARWAWGIASLWVTEVTGKGRHLPSVVRETSAHFELDVA